MNGRNALLVAAVTVMAAVYVLPLGVRPLTATDEYRYAEIPREMLRSGDWVSPRLNGLPYFEKPAGAYWPTAVCIAILGENAFVVRLPSVLATLAAAAAVFVLGRRGCGRAAGGWLAALVYLGATLVFLLGTAATTDAPLTAAITFALTAFYLAHTSARTGDRLAWLAAFGAGCGIAFLVKGFIGLAVPALVVGAFLVVERRFRSLVTLPWVPLAAAAVLALPWCVAIAVREPDYWRYFFWEEHIQRFTGRGYGVHSQSVFYYVPVLLGGLLPWVFLAPGAVAGLRKIGWRSTPLVRYLSLWLGVPFLLFSASSGKLTPYILPCFPAVAVLFAMGTLRDLAANGQRRFAIGTTVTLVLVALVLAAGLVEESGAVPGGPLLGSGAILTVSMLAAGALFWMTALVLALRSRAPESRLAWFGVGHAVTFLAFLVAMPVNLPVFDARYPERLLTAHRELVTPDTVLVSDSKLAHAVCWHYRRSDVFILTQMGEFDYGLRTEAGRGRFLTGAAFRDLVRRNATAHPVVAVLRLGSHRSTFPGYPKPDSSFSLGGVWLGYYRPRPRP
jgi:4-amino-4-deoxy-L-arabinose transferase